MMRRTKIFYTEEGVKNDRFARGRGGRLSDKSLDLYYAAILGHAVGDALGVPVEFMSRDALALAPVTDMMGYGTYPVPEGSWSDDTSMVLATLDALSEGRVDVDAIMRNFVLWVTENKYTPTGVLFDIGGTSHCAIRNYMATADAKNCGLSDACSNGNGSLMRILPVALLLYARKYSQRDAIEVVHRVSALTHAHPRSLIACGIFAFVLWELLRSPTKDSIGRGLQRAKEFYQVEQELSTYEERLFRRIGRILPEGENNEDFPPLAREEIRSSGYVVDTLEAVIWCLLTTNDYKSCVLTAVNLGEDTDTIGAIAGSLAAILYGIRSIPSPWISALQARDTIESLCQKVFEGWRVEADVDGVGREK